MNSILDERNKQVCIVCKREVDAIAAAHVGTHGLSLDEYELLFGKINTQYKQCSFTAENYSKKESSVSRQCSLNCLLDSKDDKCLLHSEDPPKNQILFDCTIDALCKLHDSAEDGYAFEGMAFPSGFKLPPRVFTKPVMFTGSRFYGEVELRETFQQKASFRNCTFYENVNFGASKFIGTCIFERAIFIKGASFSRCHFEGEANFWRAEFGGETSFFQAHFNGAVFFGYGAFPRAPHVMLFIDTKFSNSKDVLFASVDFSRTLFRYTKLSHINFSSVDWPLTTKLRGKRRVVFDEINIDTNNNINFTEAETPSYAHVKNIYQQLTRNYEERRGFSEAGDFYFGEMECYRKSNIFRRYLPSLTNLYRISSGYGQRYVRAGVVLLSLIVVFSLAHMFLGLSPREQSASYHEIYYSLQPNFSKPKEYFADFGMTVVYCVEVLTREQEPDRLFRPLNFYGEALNVSFSLLVYIQVLFFILALRRHFKR